MIAIALVILCLHNGDNRSKSLTLKSVKSVKIVRPYSGIISNYKDLYFDLNKKEDKDMVNNILSWLKSGRIMGNASNEAVWNGGAPAYLVIELKNGTKIYIHSSVSNGGAPSYSTTDLKGEVTIRTIPVKQDDIRVLSPKLKSFIENGWKDFFNTKE